MQILCRGVCVGHALGMTETVRADTAPATSSVVRQPMLIAGVVLWAVLVLIAFLGELLWDIDYWNIGFPRLAPPSWEHPLGTTILGEDMLALLIRGTRTSILFVLPVVATTTVIGAGLAMLAAAIRCRGHVAVGRLVDVVLIALAVAVVARHAIGFSVDTKFGRTWIALSALDWLWLAVIPLCVLIPMIVRGTNRRPIVATTELIAANIALVAALAMMYEAWLPEYSVRPPDTSLGQVWTINHQNDTLGELSTHPMLVLPTAAMIVLIATATYLLTTGLLRAGLSIRPRTAHASPH